MATRNRNTFCDGCDRPIDVDTAHITFDHYLDGTWYSFICVHCGYGNVRPISAVNIDKLIEQILR